MEPLPMIATRLPERLDVGWPTGGVQIGPSKLSWPSNCGNFGLANVPTG